MIISLYRSSLCRFSKHTVRLCLNRGAGTWSSRIRTVVHWRGIGLPVGVGVTYLCYQQYEHIREKTNGQVRPAWRVYLYRSLPLRSISRTWGWVAENVPIPVFLRRPIYGLYVWRYGCNMEEAVCSDLKEYPTLSSFFRRSLREECRPVDEDDLVSPADGIVTNCGRIKDGMIDQVKGLTYTLEAFLGPDLLDIVTSQLFNSKRCLYFCTVYLAPGDYHGFHAPAEFMVTFRRHFSGYLLGVSDKVLRRYPDVLCLNERVLMSGEWKHGFFSMTAVGATNVGNIILDFEKNLNTNRRKCSFLAHEDRVVENLRKPKGQKVGEFNLGSSVVLIFEASENFQFKCQSGQKVKYGQCLGHAPSGS